MILLLNFDGVNALFVPVVEKKLTNPFTILLADRNRYIREFLKRELTAAGYRVRLDDDAGEAMRHLFDPSPLDILIYDPDLPGAEVMDILRKLRDRIPIFPVVIHIFLSEFNNKSSILNSAVFIEKEGSCIDHLKEVVSELLYCAYPRSFDKAEGGEHGAKNGPSCMCKIESRGRHVRGK